MTLKTWITAFAVLATTSFYAQETVKQLPPPDMKGGKPLMEVLSLRKSSREYNPTATLTDKELGDLLWAANGYNREEMRTAPSALNAQAVDIYVFKADGVWFYEAKEHRLKLVLKGDHREVTGKQPFVKDAAVNLVFVYDMARSKIKGDGRWCAVDAAFVSENVYLYCASTGLKTVVRGSVDAQKVAQLLKLGKQHIVTLAQCIGK